MLDSAERTTTVREACPECGSKDNVAVYPDGGKHCYSPDCSYHVNANGKIILKEKTTATFLSKGKIKSISDRSLSYDTCSKYGVSILEEPDQHVYPYYNEKGQHIANKIRNVKNKTFHSEGNIKETMLFGQNLFGSGGKFITICEGEIDALSAYEMLGSKWPVVSIKNGSASAKRDVSNKSIYDFLM
jgi:twinkle protein